MRATIAGTGAYLPDKVLTNADLVAVLETSEEWIVERTGIHARHIAAKGEKTSDMAVQAAAAALASAGIDGKDVDLIVLATATPDETFPATATVVQDALHCYGGPAFDVQAVCSGFIYALAVADNFIKVGQAKTAMVIGAETFSRILDWTDRSTCVLFGDGAGAVVLKAEEGTGTLKDRGILETRLHADGRRHDFLYVDGGPSSTQSTGHLRMAGREVFRHAVINLSSVAEETLAAVGLTGADIDWIVPHQANKRIIDGTARKLGVPDEKVVVTLDRHANTSAASIPLALNAAVSDGRIQRGHMILMEAMGGGFTWGSALVRF